MRTWLRLILLVCPVILLAGCGLTWPWEPTPLGWRSSVSYLLIDESALPGGWQVEYPGNIVSDPTISLVSREWGRPWVAGRVRQVIWRARSEAAAKGEFDALLASQFEPSRPLYPGTVYVPFEPPAEISFWSQVADEFYLACGWWRIAYCEVIARYRNYTVELWLDREAEHEGHITDGLTYAEIETAIRAMDAKFVQFLANPPAPSP